MYNLEGLPASPFEAELPAVSSNYGTAKKAAVVVTYDDALEVHLDNAIPALEERGFVGTFYLSANYEGSENRIADWRRAAQKGHELGNHTLYHPCDNSDGTRTWITPENDLANYTTAQIEREVHMTNVFSKGFRRPRVKELLLIPVEIRKPVRAHLWRRLKTSLWLSEGFMLM